MSPELLSSFTLEAWQIALLAFAAFAAGMVDAIAGGGGLLSVPSLLAAGLPPQIALATNKGQACFGAVSSFTSFWTKKEVDRHRAPLGFVAGFCGSLAGARILLVLKPEPLKPLVLFLLVLSAALVMYPRRPRTGPAPKGSAFAQAPIAFGLGFYDGFFGPGTGSILIVAFVHVFGDTLTRASGNAKVVNLASNLAAVLLFALKGAVLWKVAAPMALANALGAFVGARLAIQRGDRLVRVVVLVVVGLLVSKVAHDIIRR